MPVPFVRGGSLGLYANLGSTVLVKGQASIQGARGQANITTIKDSNIMVQGLGLALAGTSIDYSRTTTGSNVQSVLNFTSLGGLLGIEYNFTTNQLSVGMMPSAKFAVIGGVYYWSDAFSNPYRDYFLMSWADFELKYGATPADYKEWLNSSENGWGAPREADWYNGTTMPA